MLAGTLESMTEPSFLQSADWARFQAAVKHPSIESDGVRYFKNALPLGGSYLYCPHPDVADPTGFLDRSVRLAKEQRAWFVRVEANVGSASIQYPVSSIEGIPNTQYPILNTLPVQPADTWHVPLASDEAMLAAMHEKTRYNIRVAEKRGVSVRFSSNPTDVLILSTLLEKTGERVGIRIHPASYYQTMMEVLSGESREQRVEKDSSTNSTLNSQLSTLTVELAIAEHENKPIAAALIAHYGTRIIYLHGGSDYTQRNLMAPYALHWAIICRARDQGATVYDMGGVAPEAPGQANSKQQTANSEDVLPEAVRRSPFAVRSLHPWAGISRFKQGFGGHAIHYPPAVDVVVQSTMYRVYQLGRRLHRSIH